MSYKEVLTLCSAIFKEIIKNWQTPQTILFQMFSSLRWAVMSDINSKKTFDFFFISNLLDVSSLTFCIVTQLNHLVNPYGTSL